MLSPDNDQLVELGTTCGSLLYELQVIWDEMGEPDEERDRMLLQLEQECLEVYRRKVDQANKLRAQLHQTIADYEAELASICSALGDRPVLCPGDKRTGSLKEQLAAITPLLEEMRRRKEERIKQIQDVKIQIQRIANEISGSIVPVSSVEIDEMDLSARKLEELQKYLQVLQKEKSARLFKVIDHVNTIHGLCLVLGMDFQSTVSEVHPTLDQPEQAKSICDNTIERLAMTIQNLREEKRRRMQRLQDLGAKLLELWNLMDTPVEEQLMFENVTCNVAASENEICSPGSLSVGFLEQVQEEVNRLEELKGSKLKELVFKKRSELEEICRKTHLMPNGSTELDKAIDSMDSGLVDPEEILESIEMEIGNAKEEAFSRKEILEKIEKWLAACDEETWLEDYNKDENRYSASRGAHLILKRAEKARATVNKLPAMVESLTNKTLAWEKERGKEFLYDGVRVLSMLDDYNLFRQEKEEERRRQRDQKRIQGQLITEQEVLYGSKPSPAKPISGKKVPGQLRPATANRRLSLGGAMLQPTSVDLHSTKTSGVSRQLHVLKETKRGDKLHHNVQKHRKDDSVTGLPMYRHPIQSSGQENENYFTQVARRPLSPVSTGSTYSYSNSLDEKLPNSVPLKALPPKSPLAATTPLKQVVWPKDEENATTPMSNIKNSNPTTPMSVPMHLVTPPVQQNSHQATNSDLANPLPSCISDPTATNHENQHERVQSLEISFEEKRAGFIPPEMMAKAH